MHTPKPSTQAHHYSKMASIVPTPLTQPQKYIAYILLCHNQSAPPTGAKRLKDKMSLNLNLAPRGGKQVHNCCQGNTAGCLSGVTGDGKGNPPISLCYWIWIVPCGYAPTACGALLSPVMLEWQKQVAGPWLVGGSWSTTSPTWEIAALSPPKTLMEDLKTRSGPKDLWLPPWYDDCPVEAASLSFLLAAITYASACLSVCQPARQTAWRMRADKRPIRQVIARVFFKS